MKEFVKKIKVFIETYNKIKKFKLHMNFLSKKNKLKRFRVKITEEQMELLYLCSYFGINNSKDFNKMLIRKYERKILEGFSKRFN